jgi:uncharacterized RDD family membrane protein YckC
MQPNMPQDNPYAAPSAGLADIAEAGPDLPLASRGARLGATLLDGVIAGVALMLAFLPSILVKSQDAGSWSLALVLLILVALIVVNAVLAARNGQTIGKYLLKIRVARPNGDNPGLSRIFFVRYLPVTVLGALPLVGAIVALADTLMIFRDNRRCLHDEIADTIVVVA